MLYSLPAASASPIDQGTARVLLETGKMLESIALAKDPSSPGGSRLTAREKAEIRPKLRQALSALLALAAALAAAETQVAGDYDQRINYRALEGSNRGFVA